MTDLVERLRHEAEALIEPPTGNIGGARVDAAKTMRKAADRIETLEAEITRLRELIVECRAADRHAGRTGDEARWDRAFHNLCHFELGNQPRVRMCEPKE